MNPAFLNSVLPVRRPWRPCRRLAPLLLLPWLAMVTPALSQSFHLPTANRALFEPGGEERYFVGTVNKPWPSGTFGCVRSDGWQMHEGLDIRCLQRDRQGEPTDPVLATADGTVAYVSARPSLSNYGNYLLLRHAIDGLEIYSLYAHLREIRPGLKTGASVKAGEAIATLGRTSNTRSAISRERAHLHFELDLVINERFPEWYRKNFPTQRNDHGGWNGQNLLGLDPRRVLLEQQRLGAKFNLVTFVRNGTELCRVFVRDSSFSWVRRHPLLVRPNPRAELEGIVGYELVLNFNGLPYEAIPRAASEVNSQAKFLLLSVNAAEQQKNPARRLVSKDRRGQWQLANAGLRLLDLLAY